MAFVASSNTVEDSMTELKKSRPREPRQWSVEDVGDWLGERGFSQYRDTFILNDVSGSILVKMDRSSLTELVPSLGHRLQLLDEIEKISGPKVPRHVGEGVVGGVTGLASKFMHGFSHLMNDPIDGVSKEGVNGLMKGLGTGFRGAIQYPAEGVALFSKQLGDGLRYTPNAIFGETELWERSSDGKDCKLARSLELMKPEFFTHAEEISQKHPAHLGEGILFGIQKWGSEAYDGFTGLVTEPAKAATLASKEASADQFSAVARGLAKGLTGAFCKPMAGSFDFAALTVEGLIATPNALLEAAKDGPSIEDTPTYQRIASIRYHLSPDMLKQKLGLQLQPVSEAE